MAAQPRAVANDDWCSSFGKCWRVDIMLTCVNGNVRANVHVVADAQAAAPVEEGCIADGAALSDHYLFWRIELRTPMDRRGFRKRHTRTSIEESAHGMRGEVAKI